MQKKKYKKKKYKKNKKIKIKKIITITNMLLKENNSSIPKEQGSLGGMKIYFTWGFSLLRSKTPILSLKVMIPKCAEGGITSHTANIEFFTDSKNSSPPVKSTNITNIGISLLGSSSPSKTILFLFLIFLFYFILLFYFYFYFYFYLF